MTELLLAAQMRAMEKAAIDSGDATGRALMERAGVGVVTAMLDEWPAFHAGNPAALVLCGPGNNGGDGFVIARMLEARGWSVRVLLFGDPAKLPPDAKANHDIWAEGHDVPALAVEAITQGERPDVIIDAVFGIGLTRPLPEVVAQALDVKVKKAWKKAHDIKRVAVDCPSGLDLDTGKTPIDFDPDDPGPMPKTLNTADLTVTFHTPKLGHYLALGPTLCGKLAVVDIGLGRHGAERAVLGMLADPERVRLTAPFYQGRPLPQNIWPKSHIGKGQWAGHKFDHGHAIVFAGGVGRGGAARLAARAALRVGAGLVTVLCPPSSLIENASQLNAIMLRALPKDTPLDDIVDNRATAFCLGPGMGVSEHTATRVIEVLSREASHADWRAPAVVLDADALTSFQDTPERLFDHTHDRTILTPHMGEFERLFPDIAGDMRRSISKVDGARRAADRAGCIVLLKGPDTVIAAPGGGAAVHASVHERAVPWLATAGAGDVLAGLIAGLAASPVSADLFCIAEVAAWLHVEAALSFGPGLIAEDLPEQLPKVFQDMGL